MFGYVRPAVNELKVGDFNFYKAVYCTLCHRLGTECGAFARLCLSYDFTFLSLLLSAVSGEKLSCEKGRCAVNPLQKRALVSGSDYTDYSAAACGVLAAYRFADGKADEKGLRRAGAGLASSVSASWIKRVKGKYPGLCEGISAGLDELYRAENEARLHPEDFSLDALAQKFGDILAFVCSFPLEKDGENRAIVHSVGEHVGRWIYCVDAIDDMKEDKKRGRFNPFLLSYGKTEFTDEEKMTLKCLLAGESGEAMLALQLCDSRDGASPEPVRIVENILDAGLPATAAAVLAGTYSRPGRDKMQ